MEKEEFYRILKLIDSPLSSVLYELYTTCSLREEDEDDEEKDTTI